MRPRDVDAVAAGPVGERLPGRHVVGVQAVALALLVELRVRRPQAGAWSSNREALGDGALVGVALDALVAQRVVGLDVAGLAGAAVGVTLRVDGRRVEG